MKKKTSVSTKGNTLSTKGTEKRCQKTKWTESKESNQGNSLPDITGWVGCSGNVCVK